MERCKRLSIAVCAALLGVFGGPSAATAETEHVGDGEGTERAPGQDAVAIVAPAKDARAENPASTSDPGAKTEVSGPAVASDPSPTQESQGSSADGAAGSEAGGAGTAAAATASIASPSRRLLGLPLRAEFRPSARFRTSPSASDRDLYGLIVGELGDARRDRFGAVLLARAAWNMGVSSADGEGELQDLDDSFGDAHVRLYQAMLEARRLGALDSVRAGRLYLDGAPEWLHLDGVHLRTKPLRGAKDLFLETYGGMPVHYYQGERSGDFAGGASATARPWKGAVLRADWQLLIDGNYAEGMQNHIYGATIRQRVGNRLTGVIAAHGVGDRPRDARGRAQYVHEEAGFLVRMEYFQLLSTRRRLALSADHLNGVLYDEHRFWQTSVVMEKLVGETLSLGAGAELRQLADPSESAPLSHSFQRYWVGPRARGWPAASVELGVVAEVWYSPGADGGHIITAGGDATYRIGDIARIRFGTDYARYRYDFFIGQEHEDSRRVFAAAQGWYRPWGLDGRVRYELESTLGGYFHTVWLTMGYSL